MTFPTPFHIRLPTSVYPVPTPSFPSPPTVTGYLDTHPSIMEAIKTKARRFPL